MTHYCKCGKNNQETLIFYHGKDDKPFVKCTCDQVDRDLKEHIRLKVLEYVSNLTPLPKLKSKKPVQYYHLLIEEGRGANYNFPGNFFTQIKGSSFFQTWRTMRWSMKWVWFERTVKKLAFQSQAQVKTRLTRISIRVPVFLSQAIRMASPCSTFSHFIKIW